MFSPHAHDLMMGLCSKRAMFLKADGGSSVKNRSSCSLPSLEGPPLNVTILFSKNRCSATVSAV